MTTTDLSEFGIREKKIASELLKAMCDNGTPVDFYDDEVTVMFNKNSGMVFLTNSDYQVAILVDNKLESFYSTPYHGHEGTKEELQEYIQNNSVHSEDEAFIRSL